MIYPNKLPHKKPQLQREPGLYLKEADICPGPQLMSCLDKFSLLFIFTALNLSVQQ